MYYKIDVEFSKNRSTEAIMLPELPKQVGCVLVAIILVLIEFNFAWE